MFKGYSGKQEVQRMTVPIHTGLHASSYVATHLPFLPSVFKLKLFNLSPFLPSRPLCLHIDIWRKIKREHLSPQKVLYVT